MGEKRSATIIAVAIFIVVGLVLVWAWSPSIQNRAAPGPVSEISDSGQIQNSIELSHLGIATSENFVGHRIRVIGGTLKNISVKPIRMIEVKMVFTDYDGQSVQDYTQKVLQPNHKPLDPGTQFRFEVRLENLPRTWNYRVPITEIARIGY